MDKECGGNEKIGIDPQREIVRRQKKVTRPVLEADSVQSWKLIPMTKICMMIHDVIMFSCYHNTIRQIIKYLTE